VNAAVILMAYGSPDRLSDVPDYYTDIRGGRPVRHVVLRELVERYRRLGIDDGGDPSPLNAVTEDMRRSLEDALGWPVHTGMRHWEPRIATAVESALEGGADLLVGIVLAPQWSTLSIAKYRAQFDDAVADRVETRFVDRWGTEPGFVRFLAGRVRESMNRAGTHVVFTAHSLPARILQEGDPYRDELLETAAAVAAAAEIGDWSFSFQSESSTGEPWLGPDILDHLEDIARRGVERVLVCPVGFVSDHLEIRWDIDIEAAQRADELGIDLTRIEMPNADAGFVDVLSGIALRAASVGVS
jgi:protoporphyrin/coproporphyrin ferrochelatase